LNDVGGFVKIDIKAIKKSDQLVRRYIKIINFSIDTDCTVSMNNGI